MALINPTIFLLLSVAKVAFAFTFQKGFCNYAIEKLDQDDGNGPMDVELVNWNLTDQNLVRIECIGGNADQVWLLPHAITLNFYKIPMKHLDRSSFYHRSHETSVTSLSWRSSDIERLVKIPYRRLRSLKLNDNKIELLKENIFADLKWLRTVDLSNNRIKSLPTNLFSGTGQLREVILNGNLLTSLSGTTVLPLHLLERLELSHNRIRKLPPLLLFKRNLKTLALDHNQLTQLPSMIFRHTDSLESLTVNDNAITELAADLFSKNYNLHSVRLDGNRLDSLPAGLLESLPNLKTINLSRNPLKDIPDSLFKNNFHLQHLLLTNTSIEWFAGTTLRNQVELISLSLANNPCLTELDELMLFHTPLLEKLDLSHTGLTHIPRPVIKLEYLRELNVGGNPMRCHCSNQWFAIWATDPDTYTTVVADQIVCDREHNRSGNILDVLPSRICPPSVGYISPIRFCPLENVTEIECVVFGFPRPKVKWLTPTDENFTVDAGPDAEPTTKYVTDDNKLVIPKLSFADGGRYVCEVDNGFGKVSAETNVYIDASILTLRMPERPVQESTHRHCFLFIIFLIILFCEAIYISSGFFKRIFTYIDERFCSPRIRPTEFHNIFPYMKTAFYFGMRNIRAQEMEQKDMLSEEIRQRVIYLVDDYYNSIGKLKKNGRTKDIAELKTLFRCELKKVSNDFYKIWNYLTNCSKECRQLMQDMLTKSECGIAAFTDKEKRTILSYSFIRLIASLKGNNEFFEDFYKAMYDGEEKLHGDRFKAIEEKFQLWFSEKFLDYLLDEQNPRLDLDRAVEMFNSTVVPIGP